MIPSAKAALASGLAVAMLVIAIMARECTHRGRAAELRAEIEALSTESRDKDGEIARLGTRIAALRAELDAAERARAAIDGIRTGTEDVKEAVYEAVSSEKDVYDWYTDRIPDHILRIMRDRMCNGADDSDAVRACRAE